DLVTGVQPCALPIFGRPSTTEESMKRSIVAAIVLTLASLAAWAEDKVVYHFDGGLSQAVKGLRNMRNHLDIDPKAKIIAVAHARSDERRVGKGREPR